MRPTKRSLGDLEVGLPDRGTPLNEIDDPAIAAAQSTPEQRDAGGAERVASLAAVWFNVKTSDRRAVVTELCAGEVPDGIPASADAWWIGASGRRQNDSP